MAAAAMAHANPVVRGCSGGEAGPGPDPAARSRTWGLRTAQRGLAAPPRGRKGPGPLAPPPRARREAVPPHRVPGRVPRSGRPFPGAGSPG